MFSKTVPNRPACATALIPQRLDLKRSSKALGSDSCVELLLQASSSLSLDPGSGGASGSESLTQPPRFPCQGHCPGLSAPRSEAQDNKAERALGFRPLNPRRDGGAAPLPPSGKCQGAPRHQVFTPLPRGRDS